MSEAISCHSIFLGTDNGEWLPVAGLQVSKWRLAREMIDGTLSDDQGWRRLLANAGVQSLEVAGAGVCIEPSMMSRFHELAVTGSKAAFRIRLEPASTIAGDFLFKSFEARGDVDEEATFAFELSSAGPIQSFRETA